MTPELTVVVLGAWLYYHFAGLSHEKREAADQAILWEAIQPVYRHRRGLN